MRVEATMKKQERKLQRKSNVIKRERTMGKRASVKGVVIARKCKQCGHHEMGIINGEGAYIPLKPGMKIRLLNE